jgi:GNAT superfamily N-acetyltransferase
MRRTLILPLDRPRSAPRGEPPTDLGSRSPTADDAHVLARLMLDAYRGSIDDAGETFEDAIGEIEKLLRGDYGHFDAAASELIIREGRLIAATIVTHYGRLPLIAFSLTDPAWRRQGLARAGLERAIGRLKAANFAAVRLAVTKGNTPAERLYESLGFRDAEPHERST